MEYTALYKAIVNNTIDASLSAPIAQLPDYDCSTDTTEWRDIRDKRRSMREKEEDRLEAQECFMTDYMAFVYWAAYKEDIKPTRELLQIAWDEIEKNPRLSRKYKTIFKPRGARHD